MRWPIRQSAGSSGPVDRRAVVDAGEHVLDRAAPAGRAGRRRAPAPAPGALAGLQGDEGVVVVAGDRCRRVPTSTKPHFGCGWMRPGVGERAPAGLELGEAAGVAADGDRMLVDLDAGGLVDDAGDLERRLAVHEPGAERGAVAEIVEQAAAAAGLLYHQEVGLLRLDLLGRDLDLVGEVEERAAVAVVEMDLDQLADGALVDQPLGGVVRRIPGERPVDGQPRPCPSIAAIIRRASAALAAKGFSTMTLMPCGAIASTVSACSAVAEQTMARSAPVSAEAGFEVGEDAVRRGWRRLRSRRPCGRGRGRRCRRSRRRDARRPGAAGRPCACGRS